MTETTNYNARQATSSDEPLLRQLFGADLKDVFAPLGLPPQQLEPLIAMQFRARQQHYAQAYPAAVDTILCLADGTPVGRHLVERQPGGYRGIDLAVLPEYQNRGIGTWALRHIQQIAVLEDVTFCLSVCRSNTAALRLYERLGFLKTSASDIAYEMESQPSRSGIALQAGRSFRPGESAAVSRAPAVPDQGNALDPRADRIVAFLRGIGLTVGFGPVPRSSFLPGIQPVANGLRIDTAALLYPGDLLHEAGHLAVMTPEHRAREFPVATEAAEEMAALAWSYAAAMQLGLPAEVVFHEHGYRGQSQSLIASFQGAGLQGAGLQGTPPIGLPFLWWIGLTTQAFPMQPSIFPRMLHWLRQAAAPEPLASAPLYEEALA